MANYHHKPIRRFSLDGVIQDESALGRLKMEYIRLIESEMKLSGYAPRLDIVPDFTVDYNETKKYFEFELTLYGVHIGRKQVEWIAGIDGTKPIHTLQSKSKEFSQEQA
jgi:hypothetical protein